MVELLLVFVGFGFLMAAFAVAPGAVVLGVAVLIGLMYFLPGWLVVGIAIVIMIASIYKGVMS